jgi:hypothetical protein
MARIADTTGSQTGEAVKLGLDTRLVWEGFTTDATAKELFLVSDDNPSTGGRLIVPALPSGVIVAEGLFVAFNDTDNTVFASGRFALSVTNLAGTVAVSGTTLEWDAAATDANPFIQYFVGANPAFVWTYNNTSKSIILTVTGVAAKNIRYRAVADTVIGL